MLAAIPEIIGLLADIAPTLAKAFKSDNLRPTAQTVLATVLGTSPSNLDSMSNALKNISSIPDQLAAIKKADYDFYNEYYIQLNQALTSAITDEASARNMQNVAVNRVRIELIRWVGMFTIIVFLGDGFLFFKNSIQGDEGYMIGSINAGIIGIWMMIIGFYFGTGVDKVMNYFKGPSTP